MWETTKALSKDLMILIILLVTTFKSSSIQLTNIPTSPQRDNKSTDSNNKRVNLENDVIGHLTNYSVFHPVVRELNTYKIIDTTKVDSGHHKKISFKINYKPDQVKFISTEKYIYTIFLKLVPNFWSKDFVIETHGGKTYHPTQAEMKETHCYYKGYVAGWKDSSAIISTCKGLSGFIDLRKGGLIYIEPLLQNINHENVLNVEHLIYRSTDFKDALFKCGTTDDSDIKYEQAEAKHGAKKAFESFDRKNETDQKKRYVSEGKSNLFVPYDSTPDTKYIELYVTYDSGHFVGASDEGKVVEKTNELIAKTKEIVNAVNHFFRILGIYAILVGVEFWVRNDLIKVEGETIGFVLYYYKEYMAKKASPNIDVSVLFLDVLHFMRGVGDLRVGLASTGSICAKFDACILVQERLEFKHRLAVILAHELGHVLGLKHDTDQCNCTDEKCLMVEVLDEKSRIVDFSDCSKLAANVILLEKPLLCLNNFPTSSAHAPTCGNGIREVPEDCDCGLKEDCTTKCCDATTCRLASDAKCATGNCCDLETCQIKESGVECRPANSCCDLPEYCNGTDEMCPEDEFVYDGFPCKAYGEESVCFDGECNTYNGQCQYIWGETAKGADPQCYKEFNVREDYYGHCTYNLAEDKYRRCEEEHVMCGLLHCQGDRTEPHINEYITSFHTHDVPQCKTAVYFKEPHLGLVRQGVMCGPQSICMESRCLNMSFALRTPCECGENGICTNKGNCYKGEEKMPLKMCPALVIPSKVNLISKKKTKSMTGEIQENNDNKINLEMLTHLKKLRKEAEKNKKLSENSMTLYVQISKHLSNNLPKLSDTSLFEIDDLIYAKNEFHVESISDVVLDPQLLTKCVKHHLVTYFFLIDPAMPQGRILDNTFLQVVQWISSKNIMRYKTMIRDRIIWNLNLKTIIRLCFCLKILKVTLVNHKEILVKDIYSQEEDVYYWMMTYLPNIPQSTNAVQRRITSWLAQQSRTIVETFNLKELVLKEPTKKYLEFYETHGKFDIRYLHRIRYAVRVYPNMDCDHLLLFFKSAKNDEEKIKLMKYFLLAGVCGNVDDMEQNCEQVDVSYEQTTGGVVWRCSGIVSMYNGLFRSILNGLSYPDDVLRKMEERFGCVVNPYLGGDKDHIDPDSEGHLGREIISDSVKAQAEDRNEYDLTIEKYLFFDGFVKTLNLLNITHTACMMCQELLQTSGDFMDCDNKHFRHPSGPINKFIRETIVNPSKRGSIPWLIEIMMKKCPFMVLPKRYDYLMDDLAKLLKGEQIDKLTEEKIFLAVNTKINPFDRF